MNHIEQKKFLKSFFFKLSPGCYYVKIRLFFEGNRVLHVALYYKCKEEFPDPTVLIGSIKDSLGKVRYLFDTDIS